MGAIWKKGKANTVAMDLGKDDIYGLAGDTFRCFYGNPDGTVTDVTNFSEFIEPLDNPVSCSANGDTAAGNKDVAVDDVTGFKVGMVVKIDGKDEYYYVEKVDADNNILTFRRALKTDLADETAINQVGNTGVYGTSVTIDTVGIHVFVISNPSIGLMNKSSKVEVIEHDEQDIYGKLEEIEQKLDSIEGIEGTLIV